MKILLCFLGLCFCVWIRTKSFGSTKSTSLYYEDLGMLKNTCPTCKNWKYSVCDSCSEKALTI